MVIDFLCGAVREDGRGTGTQDVLSLSNHNISHRSTLRINRRTLRLALCHHLARLNWALFLHVHVDKRAY